jgi:hypothetical protein
VALASETLSRIASVAGVVSASKYQETRGRGKLSREPKGRSRPKVIDKSVLGLPEPRHVLDRDHVRYLEKLTAGKSAPELRRQAALSNAEQHELDEWLKLYPDLPKPPENPVTRAMLDYIEKCDREETEYMAARRASMTQA